MAGSVVQTSRSDPYMKFKFRVKWNGRYVAGFSANSSLQSGFEVVEHREGEKPLTLLGRRKFPALTFEHGVTHDEEFEKWAETDPHTGAGLESGITSNRFRKDLVIEVHNEAGQQ